ncbi:hypothetical protein H0H87_002511 [Tephrocybe sp. NHM501043]|nr:hypothetical protein H0H87_002511 [Tephrocybe sp. NHM501043]
MNGNVRPDLLRQGPPPTTMLTMNPSFIPNMQQSGQQPMPGPHLGLGQSSNAGNPGMMLNNAPGGMNPQQRYLVQSGPDVRQQRPMQMRPGGQPGPMMMGPSGGPVPGGAGGPHMVGMPHSQPMGGFNPNMMNQPQGNMAVRRVSSQPQMGSGGGGPVVVNNNMGIPSGIRPMPQNMPHHLRMQTAEQIRMQGGQPPHMPNQMTPDMPMRQGGNPGMQGRTNSTQLMNSLSQPPSMQHPIGPHPNQFQNSVQHPPQIPSPRPGSLPHTPSINMTAPASHTPVNRPDDPMSFMSYPNPQFQPSQHTPRSSSGQFTPFVPSSTPPSMGEMQQPIPSGLVTPGTGNRQSFHLTPAQQYEQMNVNSTSPGAFPHFDMPPPANRPPSRLNPHTPLTQPQMTHHSPHASDSIMGPPQRPQSQPQRPPSQQAQILTPRSAHPQLPSGPPTHPARPGTGMAPPMAPQPGPSQMQGPGPAPGPTSHMQIAPRPPPQASVGPVPPQSSAAPGSTAPSDTPPATAAIPRQPPTPPVQVGQGQGLIRLLQFSAVLAAENKAQKLQLSWWSDLIKEYFTPKAMMKFTLWKDNQRTEAKPFEIGIPILPRFFLVTTQSGVKSMTLSLDGARERIYGSGHSTVECINAIWTYKYNNGYTVTLRGPMTVHVVVTAVTPPGSTPSAPTSGQGQQQQPPSNVALKFEDFQFDANTHEKYVVLDEIKGPRTIESPGIMNATPMGNSASGSLQRQQLDDERKKWDEPRVTIERASIPGEPVNAFGIPQATMRCLELAESVSSMADLITYSRENDLGPLGERFVILCVYQFLKYAIEALVKFASNLREMQLFNSPPSVLPPPMMNGPVGPFGTMHSNPSNVPITPAVTLYSSAPPSVTNPSGTLNNTHVNHAPTPTGTTASPQNAPPSASNSPQKQHKTIPQQTPGASSSSSAPAASPAVSSGGTTNTPAISNASLKRKQAGETASPATATDSQPPAKRQTRRRRTTNTNSGGGG